MPSCILIIDDDERALLVRRMVLESASYLVVTASTSADALRIVTSRSIDLVITDNLLLPGSRQSLVGELRRLRPELPVVILSGGDSFPSDDAEPPFYFLHKLDGPTEMIAKVRSALAAAHK